LKIHQNSIEVLTNPKSEEKKRIRLDSFVKQTRAGIRFSYISNNGFPTAIFEQGEHILSRFEVAVSVDTNVDKCPFVEIFQDGSEASENAFSDARPNSRIIIGTSRLGESFESFKDSNQEGLHNINYYNKPITAC
jgi:hypothetical protein